MKPVKKITSRMTLEEKTALCSGMDFWHTIAVERLGIPSLMLTDGPNGLRKQSTDHRGVDINKSMPATCFPSGAALAASFDRSLLARVGAAIGEECAAEDVAILLGPSVNIKRSPLCGRNFEYYSEDPYLAGEMAAAFIHGVQSRGVGTSIKHFAANNQETERMVVDSQVDERALREIYLKAFEIAVRKSQPWTVMCSYNKLNGTYCSRNRYILTDILRGEWGFKGFVMSDWGAVEDIVESVWAGLELEMPSSNGAGPAEIIQAVKAGRLDEKDIDLAVERILNIVLHYKNNKAKRVEKYDQEKHHEVARQVASESIVLLKNTRNLLPLERNSTIAVIGAFAKNARYQGGGSSHINPSRLDVIYNEIKNIAPEAELRYAPGYDLESDSPSPTLIQEAVNIATKVEYVLVFAGLPDSYESEGYDRKHLRMPESHNQLIELVSRANPNTVVILLNGAPVEMPWISNIDAVLEAYLGGQGLGWAIASILFGDVNPSGKLAETFPHKLSHTPAYLNFPGTRKCAHYSEGLFIGYRYFDITEIEPLFAFGHGLSYTEFEFSHLTTGGSELREGETLSVSIKLKNCGKMEGKEVVQLYISNLQKDITHPVKELKEFEKVKLLPGQEKTVAFHLNWDSFSFYDEIEKRYVVQDGNYEILIGSASDDIRLKALVTCLSSYRFDRLSVVTPNTLIGDLLDDERTRTHLRDFIIEYPLMLDTKDNTDVKRKADEVFTEAFLKELPLRNYVKFVASGVPKNRFNTLITKLNDLIKY